LNLADVRLLRHKDKRALKGRSPYELWRDDRKAFDLYQSIQNFRNRPRLNAPYWASFVATLSDRNMFVGIYNVKYKGIWQVTLVFPSTNTIDKAGSGDEYDLSLDSNLAFILASCLSIGDEDIKLGSNVRTCKIRRFWKSGI